MKNRRPKSSKGLIYDFSPLGTSTPRVEITTVFYDNIHFHFAATALLFDFGQPGETVRLRLVSLHFDESLYTYHRRS